MKEWIMKLYKEALGKAKLAAKRLDKKGKLAQVCGVTLIVLACVAAGVIAAGFIASIAALYFLIPGIVVGFLFWFVWTYMNLGLVYFTTLDPMYLSIPYWHFVGFAAVFVYIIKLCRRK